LSPCGTGGRSCCESRRVLVMPSSLPTGQRIPTTCGHHLGSSETYFDIFDLDFSEQHPYCNPRLEQSRHPQLDRNPNRDLPPVLPHRRPVVQLDCLWSLTHHIHTIRLVMGPGGRSRAEFVRFLPRQRVQLSVLLPRRPAGRARAVEDDARGMA
jgi:hypothetical protein